MGEEVNIPLTQKNPGGGVYRTHPNFWQKRQKKSDFIF
jgi:hypothetical protein